MDLLTNIANILAVDSNNITVFLTGIFASLAAVGIVTMAIVEVLKAFFVRWVFTLIQIRTYFPSVTHREKLVKLSVGSNAFFFYSLKPGEIVGRLKQVAESMVVHPTISNKNTLRVVVCAPLKDVNTHACDLVDDSWETITTADRLDDIDFLQLRDSAREDLMSAINSKLDGLQIRMSKMWDSLLQILSIGISSLIIYLLLPDTYVNFEARIVYSLLGGMIAPVAHNILGLISARRQFL